MSTRSVEYGLAIGDWIAVFILVGIIAGAFDKWAERAYPEPTPCVQEETQ